MSSMGQRSSTNDAAVKDVQSMLRKEGCVSSMGLVTMIFLFLSLAITRSRLHSERAQCLNHNQVFNFPLLLATISTEHIFSTIITEWVDIFPAV